MHASVATLPSSVPVQSPRYLVIDQRITGAESLWVGVTVVLLTLGSIDAVREIPPLGDDYWMMERGLGGIAVVYLRDYGWGRPLGIWLVDLINAVRAGTGAPLFALILVMRAAVLASVYVILRRLYGFGPGVALVSLGLAAWNPAASEAWVLLSNLHLAVSMALVLLACGMYGRALRCFPERSGDAPRLPSGASSWRWVAGGAAAQLALNLTYEQALLAVPAFVLVLSVLGRSRMLPLVTRLTVVGVSATVAIVSGLAMFATGYVGSRSSVATAAAVELSDFGAALGALWMGFAQHHLWRIVEVARTQDLWWWDLSSLGVLAATATVAASVIVAWNLVRDRGHSSSPPNIGLAAAALAAGYATLLPMGLAYPGYPIVSRLFYLPGVFVALAVAALAPPRWRVPRLALGLGTAAALLWLGMVTRRYYQDMRQGSRMLRVVARSIAHVPKPIRDGGMLVIAPSNVGTFSTSGVESWSLPPAVRVLTGLDPGGPLLVVTDCAELRAKHPGVRGESEHPSRRMAVLRYRSDSVRMEPSIELACGQ